MQQLLLLMSYMLISEINNYCACLVILDLFQSK